MALRRFLWFGIFFLENRNPKGSRESLGGIWEVLGFVKHLEGIWEAPGRHLGGIWEASAGVREASGRLGGLRGILEQKVFKTMCFTAFEAASNHFAQTGATRPSPFTAPAHQSGSALEASGKHSGASESHFRGFQEALRGAEVDFGGPWRHPGGVWKPFGRYLECGMEHF